MAKKKFYAVWKGRKTGTFETWEECRAQIDGFKGALYKSFTSKSAAQTALNKPFVPTKQTASQSLLKSNTKPLPGTIVVDAAWNTKTGDMEYQGVELDTGRKLFAQGPYANGTNNIGEFLAIVHALALLKKHKSDKAIYTDSKTAMSWIRKKKANTKLEETNNNQVLFELLERAEKWLHENTYPNKILKWDTANWGENPADYGRK